MLAVNSVLRYQPSEVTPLQRIVILWISGDGSEGYSIDLENPKSLPERFTRHEFEKHLDEGLCVIDRPNFSTPPSEISKRQEVVRDVRWEAIAEAVSDEPAVYVPSERSALYREVAEKGGFTLNTARNLFQIFWRGGKTKSALVPLFTLRGAPDVLREPGSKKLGRPRKDIGEISGLNLNRDQKRAIGVMARARYRKSKKYEVTACYKSWANRYFYQDGLDEQGKAKRVPKPEYARSGIPTLEQFKRIYYSMLDPLEALRKRSPREYALNYRPLLGSATAETWGPGSRFLIDATVADIYLVSRDNPNRIVGRPVIYVVIDVWSRLIVGLYVAIEDMSWTSAMMALANAACSKVEFCKYYGIDIKEEEWPAANIGARLLSDHGEVDSKVAGNLVESFNRIIEAAQAFRGDLKGLVETQFNTLQVQFGEFVPGYVERDFNKRGGRDYRLDALLDIKDFTATMIDLVLERNSKRLKRYDRDQGMPADVVVLSPIELWHWGIQHRSGRSQAWPEEYVRFRLMPTAVVSVDRNGALFQGRHYVGPSLTAAMTAARLGRRQKVTISFDPRVTDAVYLHVPKAEHGFEVCGLHERSRAYADRTCVEADQDYRLMNAANRDANTSEVTRSINVQARLNQRVKAAKARKVPDPDTPKSRKTAGIGQNRRAEKEQTKREHGEAFRPAPNPAANGAPKQQSAASTNFSEHGLAYYMED